MFYNYRMNIVIGKMPTAKSKPLHPMRENREFYSCNVRYVLSFYVCYILVFGCEIKEKRNRT